MGEWMNAETKTIQNLEIQTKKEVPPKKDRISGSASELKPPSSLPQVGPVTET